MKHSVSNAWRMPKAVVLLPVLVLAIFHPVHRQCPALSARFSLSATQDSGENALVAAGEYQVYDEKNKGGIGPYAPAVYEFAERWRLLLLPDGSFKVEDEREYESPRYAHHSNRFSAELGPDLRVLRVTDFRKLKWRADSGPLTYDWRGAEDRQTFTRASNYGGRARARKSGSDFSVGRSSDLSRRRGLFRRSATLARGEVPSKSAHVSAISDVDFARRPPSPIHAGGGSGHAAAERPAIDWLPKRLCLSIRLECSKDGGRKGKCEFS